MAKQISLTDVQKKDLLEYVKDEVFQAEQFVYEPLQKKRTEWEELYYGRVKPRREDWMSNFPILMGATFTDSVTARLMNTLFAYTPMYSMRPTHNSGWTQVAQKVEQFMDHTIKVDMKLYDQMRKVIFETVRLGTGAMLTPWVVETETRTVKSFFIKRKVQYPIKNGIYPKAIPMRNFIHPGGFGEVDELGWWGRKLRWRAINLREAQYRGEYINIDDVIKYEESPREADEQAATRANEATGTYRYIHGYEIWLKYDLKGDGNLQRYLLTWHEPTNTIMRFEEDTYPKWPLQLFRYGPRDYGLNGLGIMEMTAPYDMGLYAMYNLLVDNFNVSTMQCLKGKKGGNIQANMKIYPGKVFMMDNPAEDLLAFNLGQPFVLNPSFTRAIWDLGERRAGVSDYSLGRESPSAGGKATATGTLALIQEGQRRFDLTITDIRQCMDDFGMFTLEMIHDRLPRELPYMVLGEDGQYVQQFLDLPAPFPKYALNLVSSFSTKAMNKELEKQDAQATFQLLGGYYEQVMQLTLMLPQVPPPVQQVIGKILLAASEKMKKVLTTYGEMAPELYSDVAESIVGGANAGQDPQGAEAGLQRGADPGSVAPSGVAPTQGRPS